MDHYVLGFAFDTDRRLALIKKNRPDWQKGRWNGIGGHVEPIADTGEYESCAEAMSREFFEETGVHIPSANWRQIATMIQSNVWTCAVYTVEDKLVKDATTQTDEQVKLFSCQSFKRIASECIENVPTLIELACMKVDHTGWRPTVTFDYGVPL